jgi:hypothetical protein
MEGVWACPIFVRGWPSLNRGNSTLGQALNQRLDDSGQDRGRTPAANAIKMEKLIGDEPGDWVARA